MSEKAVVFAPTPNARVKTTIDAKPGVRRHDLAPCFRSRQNHSI
jgi:hypothetical protein